VARICSLDVHGEPLDRPDLMIDDFLAAHARPPCFFSPELSSSSTSAGPMPRSWLNMVEIEVGVLRSQCLDRRIDTKEQLESEIAACECQRNASGARVKWMFTTDKAAPKWVAPTPSSLPSARPKPKSHNHCAALLVPLHSD